MKPHLHQSMEAFLDDCFWEDIAEPTLGMPTNGDRLQDSRRISWTFRALTSSVSTLNDWHANFWRAVSQRKVEICDVIHCNDQRRLAQANNIKRLSAVPSVVLLATLELESVWCHFRTHSSFLGHFSDVVLLFHHLFSTVTQLYPLI